MFSQVNRLSCPVQRQWALYRNETVTVYAKRAASDTPLMSLSSCCMLAGIYSSLARELSVATHHKAQTGEVILSSPRH